MTVWVVSWEDSSCTFSTKAKAKLYLKDRFQKMGQNEKIEVFKYPESDETQEVYEWWFAKAPTMKYNVSIDECIIDAEDVASGMQTTGIIKRIDDLGRVVIPKVYREKLNIKEGDPLQIFMDIQNSMIGFQRYDPEEYD